MGMVFDDLKYVTNRLLGSTGLCTDTLADEWFVCNLHVRHNLTRQRLGIQGLPHSLVLSARKQDSRRSWTVRGSD
jgi:hypothetical protein